MGDDHVIDLESEFDSIQTPYYECDFCDDYFYSRADLKIHLRHHNCVDINCSSCHTTGEWLISFNDWFDVDGCVFLSLII